MNTEELKQRIADGDKSAFELLIDAMPTASTRFHRLAGNMAKLLDDVREHFPEARFYTSGGDGFHSFSEIRTAEGAKTQTMNYRRLSLIRCMYKGVTGNDQPKH